MNCKGYFWFALIAAWWPTSSDAQVTHRLEDEPTCGSCRAELVSAVRLGSTEDPLGFGPLAQVAVNSRGQYVVSSSTFDGVLAVYDGAGRFLKSVGRHGGGPGEFERSQFVAFDAADSLHTLDMSGPRRSVFAPDLTFVRTFQIASRSLAMELEPDGSVFVVTPAGLQMFSRTGALVLTFDPVDAGARGPAAMLRSIAIDGRNMRWSVGAADYTVKQWGVDGELVQQFVARRDWIPEDIPMRLDRGQKPPSQIGGIEFDEDGLLWLFAIVPDSNWRPPEEGATPSPGETFDTLIEVIDPEAGAFVARGRSDAVVLPFAQGLAYSMVDEPTGDRRLQVWHMRVSGR